jgi:hypothetical protein
MSPSTNSRVRVESAALRRVRYRAGFERRARHQVEAIATRQFANQEFEARVANPGTVCRGEQVDQCRRPRRAYERQRFASCGKLPPFQRSYQPGHIADVVDVKVRERQVGHRRPGQSQGGHAVHGTVAAVEQQSRASRFDPVRR